MLNYLDHLTEDLKQELNRIAEEHGFHPAQLHAAMKVELDLQLQRYRSGVFDRLSDIILQELTAEEKVQADAELMRLLAEEGTSSEGNLTLLKLEIENFGPYPKAEIAFSTDLDRPITLLGGGTGAGKTTVLQALRTILYGVERGWPRPEPPLTRTAAERRVRLALDFRDFDNNNCRITRRIDYTKNPATPTETVNLHVGAEVLNDQEVVEWVEGRLPCSLTDYFFFDAEGVREFLLMQGKTLRFGLEKVLRIELFTRLTEDVEHVVRRLMGKRKEIIEGLGPGSGNLGSRGAAYDADEVSSLKKLQAGLEAVLEERSDLEKKRTQVLQKLDTLKVKQAESDEKLDALLKSYSDERQRQYDQVVKDEGEAESELKDIENQIKHNLETAFPWHLLRDGLRSVLRQAVGERVTSSSHETTDLVYRLYDKAVEVFGQHHLDARLLEVIFEPVRSILELRDNPDIPSVNAPEIGEYDRSRLERVHSGAEGLPLLSELLNARVRVEERLLALQLKKRRLSPPDEEGKRQHEALIKERDRLNKEEGFQNKKLWDIEDSLRTNTLKEKEVQKNIARSKGLTAELLRLNAQIERARQFQSMVIESSGRFRESQVKSLEALASEFLALITNKPDVSARIVIDPQTLEASLDSEDKTWPFAQLSEGQKQFVSMALIAALSRVAKMRIPVVIDTPFGRLEKKIRMNLSRNFLKSVSHQVIVLSTDQELVGDFLDEVRQSVGRSYTINPSPEHEGLSTITEGYFVGNIT